MRFKTSVVSWVRRLFEAVRTDMSGVHVDFWVIFSLFELVYKLQSIQPVAALQPHLPSFSMLAEITSPQARRQRLLLAHHSEAACFAAAYIDQQ